MRGLTIGERMKSYYEEAYKIKLPMRMPIILRIDGRTFHTWTKRQKLNKPFDEVFISNMAQMTKDLCQEIGCVELAYIQSDEISLFIHGYKKLDSQGWFANELQKIVSVSAAFCSSWFSRTYETETMFDARAFVLPENEVANYFLWRQQDASRNSIQMLAQSLYSHKQLQKKKTSQLHDLIHEKGLNWNDMPTHQKRGYCVVKRNKGWEVDWEIPLFNENRGYIENHLAVDE